MKALAGTFDLLIATALKTFDMSPFMNALKLDGTLVNAGALEVLKGLDGMAMAYGRKSVAGSLIGGIAETQEVIDYCAARGTKADVEVVRAADVNHAFERAANKDVRYRFVIEAWWLMSGSAAVGARARGARLDAIRTSSQWNDGHFRQQAGQPDVRSVSDGLDTASTTELWPPRTPT
jgi:hypothetical protein